MARKYHSFKEFYPFYLSEHRNPVCRLLHFLGTLSVLVLLIYTFLSGRWIFLAPLPLVGYGFAWAGHFLFEKNRPATFTYPFYSLAGDWVMFAEILVLRRKFKE